jgi:hypothetical protein
MIARGGAAQGKMPSVRSVSLIGHCGVHRYTLATASADNIKQWKFPRGEFLQNLSGQRSIINCMAVPPQLASPAFYRRCASATAVAIAARHSL